MVKGNLGPFLQSVLELKSVKRSGWISKVKIRNPESVADHTFSMCAIAMLLSDILGLDVQKVMKMVILHDLAESIVGDYTPGDVAAREKIAEEKKAMVSILARLPRKVRGQYKKIWLEYLQSDTPVARFVHRLDKLEMALQANRYAQQGYAVELLVPFFQSAKVAVGGESDIVSKILYSLGKPKHHSGSNSRVNFIRAPRQ